MKKFIILIFLLALVGCSTQSRVEKYVAQAREYSEQNEHFKALELLNKAIELAPNDTAALYSRYEAHNSLGYKQNAYNDISKLAMMYPDSLNYLLEKASLLNYLNKYQEAINILNPMIRKDSCNAKFFTLRAFAYFNLKESIRALEDYSKAISLEPTSSSYSNLGVINYGRKEYSRSMADLNMALKLNPYCSISYLYRGLSRLKLFDTLGALEDLNNAINIDSNQCVIFYNRGEIYAMLNRTTEALYDFQKSISFNPTYVEPYFSRAVIRLQKGDDRNALMDLEAFYKYDSSYAPVIRQISHLKSEFKDYEASIRFAQKAVEVAPKSAESLLHLGLMKTTKLINSDNVTRYNSQQFREQLTDIIEIINKAIELEPSNKWCYRDRGFIKYLLNDDSACSDYRTAIDYGLDKPFVSKSIELYCPDLFK